MTTLQAVMTSIRMYPSGRLVNPLALTPNDIDIADIAHHLSNQTRFAGGCSRFYSVAEHSVNVMKNVPEEYAMEALLHDASEAYLVDLPSPVKNAPGFELYKMHEQMAELVIGTKFGLDLSTEARGVVKIADRRMLATEMRDLTNRSPDAPYPIEPYATVSIIGMGPVTARRYFLAHFHNLVQSQKSKR
jgi:hypothetical protein